MVGALEPRQYRAQVSNRLLAGLLRDFPDAAIVLDGQGLLRWGNHAAERLFGRLLDESVGLSALELVHPDDLELVLRSFASVQRKVVGTLIEVRARVSSRWRLLEVIGAPVDWFGEPAVLFSLRDLTDRRRFEVAHNQEARFRSLVQNAAAVTILVSPTGRVDSVSGALSRVLGHDPEVVERRPLAELVVEADRPALTAAFERARRKASASNPVIVDVRMLRHVSTESVPFELSIVNLVGDPTVGGFVVSAHDITSRVATEVELRETLSLLTATLDSTADGILVVNTAGKITSFNRRFADMWHLPESVLAPRDDAAAIAFVMDQLVDPEAFEEKVGEVYASPDAEINDSLQFKDGRVFERYSRPQRVDGALAGRVWSFRDVTEHKRLETELSHQAFHDSLTGLANKVLFQDRLQHAVARCERTQGRLAFLFLDLDDFKTVNDSLGHVAGDELLRAAAKALGGCLRSADTAARLGGDEFAVLIDQVAQPSDAIRVAKRILKVFRKPFSVGSNAVSATVSIGITYSAPGITSDQLLRNADLAMYAAKERGKNRYAEFQDEMHIALAARLAMGSGAH